MAHWRSKLKLKDVYHAGMSMPKLAGIVADRLEALFLPMGISEELKAEHRDIVADFRALSKKKRASNDSFDRVMEHLYDWADTRIGGRDFSHAEKMCWVET